MIKKTNKRIGIVISRETLHGVEELCDYECISKSRLTENLYRMLLDGRFDIYYDEIISAERM